VGIDWQASGGLCVVLWLRRGSLQGRIWLERRSGCIASKWFCGSWLFATFSAGQKGAYMCMPGYSKDANACPVSCEASHRLDALYALLYSS